MTVLAPLMKIQLFGHERIIANRFQQVYFEGLKYEKDIIVTKNGQASLDVLILGQVE